MAASSAYAVEERIPSLTPLVDLPPSNLLSETSKEAISQHKIHYFGEFFQKVFSDNPITMDIPAQNMPEIRNRRAEVFFTTTLYKKFVTQFEVSLQRKPIAGVPTDIFTPTAGIASRNKNRVLINIHGGGWYSGSRTYSYMESIPIAAVGEIKVVSVDYRLSPEARFPAGVDDLIAVYTDLLKQYKPENIGIFGTSAGGVLIAQAMARFQQDALPMPGAIAMIRGAANGMLAFDQGDSTKAAFNGEDMVISIEEAKRSPQWAYYNDVDLELDNPLVYPGRYPEIMANFPPSLLLVSTRDFTMSSTVHTHSQLVKLGVEAELHVWEGLDHHSAYNPEQPETRDSYNLIVRFFDNYLGAVQ